MSEPLSEDVTVSGKIVANLFASTSGTDSDWIVKLIDVYPEKYTADPDDGRLPADDRGRRLPRPLSQELREARAADARCGRALPDRVPGQRPRLSQRPPDHGSGAELMVSGDRSQSADVRAEHLPRARSRIFSRQLSASSAQARTRRTSRFPYTRLQDQSLLRGIDGLSVSVAAAVPHPPATGPSSRRSCRSAPSPMQCCPSGSP